jgi:predicted ester cyclase
MHIGFLWVNEFRLMAYREFVAFNASSISQKKQASLQSVAVKVASTGSCQGMEMFRDCGAGVNNGYPNVSNQGPFC